MQNGEEASPSVILARQALFVKMLITLEQLGAFGSNFSLMYSNIVQPLATRLHRPSFSQVNLF